MRINLFIAKATGMSRRAADNVVASGRVRLNDTVVNPGTQVNNDDPISLDGHLLHLPEETTTIVLNKPAGFVCSRDGQGSRTVYELLPSALQDLNLKTVGRLDKDSSGVLLLTNDGQLAQRLTHPSFRKTKVYELKLGGPLKALHHQMITDIGVQLSDGRSRLSLERMHEGDDRSWRVTMHEGRNRQIRRTFASLGYQVAKLHRTQFGDYMLNDLASGAYREIA